MELVVGFLSGALVGVIGSAATVYFSRISERNKDLEERRHRIYMMLLDANQRHFWISSFDYRGEEIPVDVRAQFQESRYKIADELRGADDLRQLPDIIDALFSLRFRTETDRAERISQVIDDLAKDVNPRFVAAARKLEKDTEELFGPPGTEDFGREWARRRKKVDPL